MNIGQYDTALCEAVPDQPKEAQRLEMGRNPVTVEGVQDNGVINRGIRPQKGLSIADMALDGRWQIKILPGKHKRYRIDVNNRHLAPGTTQHRRECTAATSNQKNIARLGLEQQPIKSMNIGS